MNPTPLNVPSSLPAASGEEWYADTARMGLGFSTDGSQVTLTPEVMPYLFGRAAAYDFRLTMTTTALWRLRHLLVGGDKWRHVPVRGHIVAYDGTVRPTTRLLATTGAFNHPRVLLEVTTWLTAADGSEAWLDTHLLDNLTSADVDHTSPPCKHCGTSAFDRCTARSATSLPACPPPRLRP